MILILWIQDNRKYYELIDLNKVSIFETKLKKDVKIIASNNVSVIDIILLDWIS